MTTQFGGGLLFMLPTTRYNTKTSAQERTVRAFPVLYTQIIYIIYAEVLLSLYKVYTHTLIHSSVAVPSRTFG
jgi:hypothetical protein